MKLRSLALLALPVALAMSTASAHETRTDTRAYTQAAGDNYILLCGTPDPDLGELGGGCFSFLGDEESVSKIEIRDETGLPVGGYYEFTDAFGETGENLGSGSFCGSISNLAIPEGANGVGIWVDGPAYGPLDCLLSDTSPGIGIKGEIDVTFLLKEEV